MLQPGKSAGRKMVFPVGGSFRETGEHMLYDKSAKRDEKSGFALFYIDQLS